MLPVHVSLLYSDGCLSNRLYIPPWGVVLHIGVKLQLSHKDNTYYIPIRILVHGAWRSMYQSNIPSCTILELILQCVSHYSAYHQNT